MLDRLPRKSATRASRLSVSVSVGNWNHEPYSCRRRHRARPCAPASAASTEALMKRFNSSNDICRGTSPSPNGWNGR